MYRIFYCFHMPYWLEIALQMMMTAKVRQMMEVRVMMIKLKSKLVMRHEVMKVKVKVMEKMMKTKRKISKIITIIRLV